MSWDGDELQTGPKVMEDLEPYRRLIELQRQMIELSQQHEQAKRERDALRETVAREMADHWRARRSLRHRWQQKTIRFLKRWRLLQLASRVRFLNRIKPTPTASNGPITVP